MLLDSNGEKDSCFYTHMNCSLNRVFFSPSHLPPFHPLLSILIKYGSFHVYSIAYWTLERQFCQPITSIHLIKGVSNWSLAFTIKRLISFNTRMVIGWNVLLLLTGMSSFVSLEMWTFCVNLVASCNITSMNFTSF